MGAITTYDECKEKLLNEINSKIDRAYDDCNFDAIQYLEEILEYVENMNR